MSRLTWPLDNPPCANSSRYTSGATSAVEKAARVRDLRIAEVAELDLQIENGVVKAYRAKVKVSFESED